MAHTRDVAIPRQVCKWEAHTVVDPTKGTDGIPDADEVRFAFAGECALELSRNFKIDMLGLDHADGVGNQPFIAPRQQTYNVEHPTKGASGVSAATEAEDVHLVSRFEIPHQELIRVGDVVGDAVAEGKADDLGPPLAHESKGAARAHGSYSGMVISDLRRIAG